MVENGRLFEAISGNPFKNAKCESAETNVDEFAEALVEEIVVEQIQ